ncbi:BED zinc finger [Schistosoma japonicum]|nr:BED zinc finger [Schistosoma japonicum]
MNSRQFCQPAQAATDNSNKIDRSQHSVNSQREFDNPNTDVVLSNNTEEHGFSTTPQLSATASTTIPFKNCYINRNNHTPKMTMDRDFQRGNTTNPIFNFWRNSTRRSGNWGSRTGTKKSFVWKYFFHPELNIGTKDLAHTQCILCDSLLAFNNSGTTTTMLNHLKSRHSDIVQHEYQQSKKSRCGLLTLREISKMTKLNCNSPDDQVKLTNWSNGSIMTSTTPALSKSSSSSSSLPFTTNTAYMNEFNNPTSSLRRNHRGRPPGSYRYSNNSVTNHKFNYINNINNVNCMAKSHDLGANNHTEEEVGVEMEKFATQMNINNSSPSIESVNEKCINSLDFLWTLPNMFPTLYNRQLFNATLPVINNELIPSNEVPTTLPMVSSCFNNHNFQTPITTSPNFTKDLFSELFTNYLSSSINNLPNMHLNLSELSTYYMNELCKQFNHQQLYTKNDYESSKRYFEQTKVSSKNTFKLHSATNENEILNNKFKTNTDFQYQTPFSYDLLPNTIFHTKSSQSLPVDTNEPLDLSLSTYNQKIEQEKLENILHTKSYNRESPVIMSNIDKSIEDGSNNPAFTKVYQLKSSPKFSKQFPDNLAIKEENLMDRKNCTSSTPNGTETGQINSTTWINKSLSVSSMKNESIVQHNDTEELQLVKKKATGSVSYSSPDFINIYPPSCFAPTNEEFYHHLAFFLIHDFHPPKILEEKEFKILIGILWSKFRKTNECINYESQSNLLPSSDVMENEILVKLYKKTKFHVDNKIKGLIKLQHSENHSIILPQFTISLRFWSLNPQNNCKLEKINLSFDFVDVELYFCENIQHNLPVDKIFYGTFEINKTQTLCKIIKPCWELISSECNSNYNQILSEWPIIILTNCSEYALNALKESCPIPNYLVLPCVDTHMKKAVQCALCIPEVNQVLRNYQKLLQAHDDNIQRTRKSTSDVLGENYWNDEANINECLPHVQNLIIRIISSTHLLPDSTDNDIKLIGIIHKLIDIVAEIEKLSHSKFPYFTVSIMLPILKNLYSINMATMNGNLSNEFLTTVTTHLKIVFSENSALGEFLYISTFLDPRFKSLLNQRECEQVVHILETKISSLDEMRYIEEFQQVINDYLNEKPVDINENPIQWWSHQCDKSEKYSIFKILACYYLSTPINSLNNNNYNSNTDGITNSHFYQQNIEKLVGRFGNSFGNEKSPIQTKISGNTGVINSMHQESQTYNATSIQYYKRNHSLHFWSRIGSKLIPIYRFLRKNWEFSGKL